MIKLSLNPFVCNCFNMFSLTNKPSSSFFIVIAHFSLRNFNKAIGKIYPHTCLIYEIFSLPNLSSTTARFSILLTLTIFSFENVLPLILQFSNFSIAVARFMTKIKRFFSIKKFFDSFL